MDIALAYLMAAEAELRHESEQAGDRGDVVTRLRLSEWASRVSGFRAFLEGHESGMEARWARLPSVEDDLAYRQ